MIALVSWQLALLAGFRGHLDLNVSDESHYMSQGLLMLERQWWKIDYSSSPPLGAIYAGLNLLPDPGCLLPDLVFVAVTVASTLALWWAARACVPASAAWLLAAWWAGSTQSLSLDRILLNTSVYALGLLLYVLAIGCAARRQWIAASALLVVAALNRGEIAPCIATAGILFLMLARRRRELMPPAVAFTVIGAVLFVGLRIGYLPRARAWFAFRQHFAYGLSERMAPEVLGPAGVSSFNVPKPWVEHAFPTAASILGALRENPGAFGEHVLHNAGLLWSAIAELVFSSHRHMPALRWGVLAVVALLCAVGVVMLLRGRARPAGRVPSGLRCVPPGAFVLLIGAVAVLPTTLVIRPRCDLLVPLAPGILIGIAWLASVGWSALPLRALERPAFAAAGLTLAAIVPWFLPGPFRGPEAPTLPYRTAVTMLRAHASERRVRLLSADALQLVRHGRLAAMEPIDATAPTFVAAQEGQTFEEILRTVQPDIVLILPALLDQEWRFAGIERTLMGPDWEVIESRDRATLLRRRR